MSINTTSNPLTYDTTTGASWTGTKLVRLFQWVDLNENIVNSSQLTFTVNGVTLDVILQATAPINNGVVWQIGPFYPGIPWQGFKLTALGAGAVHIWLQ